MRQLITKPSRITAKTESLLDVILVSPNSLVQDSGIINQSISNHSAVLVNLKVKPPKPILQYINTRSYRNYNAEVFTRDLANEANSILSIFEDSDVKSKLDILNDVLPPVLNSHAPIKSIKIRRRPCPFVNQEIKDLMKSRDLLLKKFLKTRQNTDWQKFKELRNTVKKKFLEAETRHTFEEVSLNKNNSRSLWKIINRAIPSKNKDIPTYTKNLTVVTNEFNQFFSKVGKNAADSSRKLAEENNITIRELSSVADTNLALGR